MPDSAHALSGIYTASKIEVISEHLVCGFSILTISIDPAMRILEAVIPVSTRYRPLAIQDGLLNLVVYRLPLAKWIIAFAD